MMCVCFKKQTNKLKSNNKKIKNLPNAYILASHLSLISSNQQFSSPPRLCLHGIAQHTAHVETE